MYKNILFGFFILCFISCKTQDVPQLKEGTFQREKPYTFLGNKRIISLPKAGGYLGGFNRSVDVGASLALFTGYFHITGTVAYHKWYK
jgi:hypothetical protein